MGWGGEMGHGGVTGARCGERESLKMPRDKRITDQYGRMDFVILKMAVRAVDSHLPEVRLTRPSITPPLRRVRHRLYPADELDRKAKISFIGTLSSVMVV